MEENNLDHILTEDEISQIRKAVDKFQRDKQLELEVGFKNINYSNYIRIIETLVDQVEPSQIESSTSLDVSIIFADGNSFRVSFQTQELIDKFIAKCTSSKNRIGVQDIQRYVIGLKPDIPGVEMMFKNKGSSMMIQPSDLDIVFKLTAETPIDDNKPKLLGGEKILYRLKDRASFTINKLVRIDATQIQQSNNINQLQSRRFNYEIEMEVIDRKIGTDDFLKQTESVLKMVQDTDTIIGKKEIHWVISEYKSLLGITRHINHLEKRSPVSIEAHHIVQFIPNRYAVTDKADGDRYNLFSLPSGLYMISNNLTIIKLPFIIDNAQYHYMLLDGEYVKNEHGKMLLLFDVIYAKQVDYRYNGKFLLVNRINILNDIVDKCFGTLIPFADYAGKNSELDIDKILKFYRNELKTYWKEFRRLLSKQKGGVKNNLKKDSKKESKNDSPTSNKSSTDILITRKLYFVPYGIEQSEIFAYADLIWKLYVYENLVPYNLDGEVYTPLNSPYMIKVTKENLDTIPLEYKWKPPNQNSIDFYIKFDKDGNSNDIIFYDSATKNGAGKPYKIARLYVGITEGQVEKPIAFKVGGVEQKAYIYAPDGVAVDEGNRAIDDSTVVEFRFDKLNADIVNKDTTIQESDQSYNWFPIKTRYDKTESVERDSKMYGNPDFIAQRIYRSIIYPVTEATIGLLGSTASFQKEFGRLSKLVKELGQVEKPQDNTFIYYQKKTDHGAGMRAFHNWVKSNMILTYGKNKQAVLDIGCGRGGDLNKFIMAGVGELVGIDIDNNGLYVINDCANCRYTELKKKNSKIPPMVFINADAKGLFNLKAQEKIIPNMSDLNKKLIQTYLSGNKTYDLINCQFTIHYYLSDEVAWSNFCSNLNKHSTNNSYLLITTFDGAEIRNKLQKKSKLTISYTDNAGNKVTFAEINKLYNDTDTNNLGLAIDLYNSTISNPGTYITEYIVEPDFLISSLKKNCGMELVETDGFYNLFNLYKKYFGCDQCDVTFNQKQHQIISHYYKALDPKYQNEFSTEEIETAKACMAFSSLNRYYVFKKKGSIDLGEPARIVGLNRTIHLDKIVSPYFDSNQMVIDTDSKSKRINQLYHHLKQHGDKPSVYIVRHSIPREEIDGEIYQQNRIDLAMAKEGSGQGFFLIYKSPDKFFYPIYHQGSKKRTYLFTNNKIKSDLDILVALTNKIENEARAK